MKYIYIGAGVIAGALFMLFAWQIGYDWIGEDVEPGLGKGEYIVQLAAVGIFCYGIGRANEYDRLKKKEKKKNAAS